VDRTVGIVLIRILQGALTDRPFDRNQ
jgi:hypothetical protein